MLLAISIRIGVNSEPGNGAAEQVVDVEAYLGIAGWLMAHASYRSVYHRRKDEISLVDLAPERFSLECE